MKKEIENIISQSKVRLLLLFASFIFFSLGCYKSISHSELDKANEYFVNGKYEMALPIYQKLYTKKQYTFDSLYNLGFIYYYEKKDLVKAEPIFAQTLKLYPNSAILHNAMSQLFLDRGQLEDAVIEYKKTVSYNNNRIFTINSNRVRDLLKEQGKS